MATSKNLPWTAITYPQDFSDEGAALGPQTILRLKRIVRTKQEGFDIRAIVLTCGIGPDIREYPKQTRPFSEMMKDWLVVEGTFSTEMIFCSANHKTWNCIETTLEMVNVIQANKLPQNVLVVSTGFHIFPRMWTTWQLLCGRKKSWRIAFAPDWDGTYNALHELAGTVKYIPMALWYRCRI